MLQQEFEEIQAWNGTNDTGEQARNKIKRNFARVNAAIEGLEQLISKSVSGVKKGMTIEWDINLPIPSGFVPANGNGGMAINGVVIPDKRGRVTIGHDPETAQTPGIATPLLKNYGKVGNIGGASGVKLTGKQSGVQDHEHDVLVYKGKYDGTGSQDGVKPTGTLKFKTSKSGYKDAEESFDNRMEYTVGFFITKVSDDVDGEGGGITEIVAGDNVDIDVTDPKKPIINVPIINGSDGEDGRGIASNVKTGTVGLIDTYRITYTDGSTTDYTVTNGANGNPGTTLTADQLQIINTVPLVCSDEKTDLTASTDVPVIRFVFQTAQSFTKIVGELNTAAAGGTFTVVAKKNGASFLSTNLTFDSGENTTRTAVVPFVFTTPTVSFAVGDYVEIFIVTAGSVTKGKGLKIYLI